MNSISQAIKQSSKQAHSYTESLKYQETPSKRWRSCYGPEQNPYDLSVAQYRRHSSTETSAQVHARAISKYPNRDVWSNEKKDTPRKVGARHASNKLHISKCSNVSEEVIKFCPYPVALRYSAKCVDLFRIFNECLWKSFEPPSKPFRLPAI